MTTTQNPGRAMARTESQTIAQTVQPARGLSLEMVIELTGYSLPEVALIRHNMAAGMRCQPDDVPFIDVAMFCKATRSLNLDPLVRQAYWISRQGKGGLQIGIDGFRAIADRAGNYAGSEAPTFRGTIEWEHRGRKLIVPEYCQVTTWKIVQGHKAAFTGEARWVEYVPRLNGAGAESDMWAKMPRNQLAKCAEAQSLRKGWALQMGALALHTDEVAVEASELPEVATLRRQVVTEQPARARPTAADYDRIIGSQYPDEQVQVDVPAEPAHPEAEQDTSAASSQAAEQSGRGGDSPSSSRRRTTAPAPAAPLDDRALDQIAEQQSKAAF